MAFEAIITEATKLRSELERGQYDLDFILETIREVSGKPEYLSYEGTKSGLEQFPRDCCDIASMLLIKRLQEGEYITGVYYTKPRIFYGHAFVGLGEVICDITADQFGGPSIYVDELVLPWGRKPYNWESGPLADFEQWPSPNETISTTGY